MNPSPKKRLFLILFLAGWAGVLSLLLADLAAIIAMVPLPPGTEVPAITPAFKIFSLIQPSVIVAVAVLVGIALAPRVGLSSPFAESLAAGTPSLQVLRPQLVPGVLGSLVGSSLVLLSAAVFKPFLATATVELIGKFARILPIPTRVLYGGITEEVLIRWGLMTLLVWATWRLFQRSFAKPTTACFIAGLLVSSFMFGLGHLPVAIVLVQEATVALVLFVIVANSAFGVVAGFLYWKYGLESAMIAHMLGHIVLAAATYAGAYF